MQRRRRQQREHHGDGRLIQIWKRCIVEDNNNRYLLMHRRSRHRHRRIVWYRSVPRSCWMLDLMNVCCPSSRHWMAAAAAAVGVVVVDVVGSGLRLPIAADRHRPYELFHARCSMNDDSVMNDKRSKDT